MTPARQESVGYAICAQLVVTWSPANETGAATGLDSVVRTIGSAAAAPVVTAVLAAGAMSAAAPAFAFSLAFWIAAGASAVGAAVAIVLVPMARRVG